MVATDADPKTLELLQYNIEQNHDTVTVVEELDWYRNMLCRGTRFAYEARLRRSDVQVQNFLRKHGVPMFILGSDILFEFDAESQKGLLRSLDQLSGTATVVILSYKRRDPSYVCTN